MNNYCVCGKKNESTSVGCWMSAVYNDKGVVVSGVCMHGVVFEKDKEETRKEYYPFLEPK